MLIASKNHIFTFLPLFGPRDHMLIVNVRALRITAPERARAFTKPIRGIYILCALGFSTRNVDI